VHGIRKFNSSFFRPLADFFPYLPDYLALFVEKDKSYNNQIVLIVGLDCFIIGVDFGGQNID